MALKYQTNICNKGSNPLFICLQCITFEINIITHNRLGGIMKKANGSFRFEPEVKEGIKKQANKENRSFNNMLEELVKRGLKAA